MIVQQNSPLSTKTNDMSSITTATDDIMTLSSYTAILSETLPHNPELQLSIHDLVHPTESAETLLETLSNEQLSIIEHAVNKIKERKLGSTTTKTTNTNHNQVSANNNAMLNYISSAQDNWDPNLVANVLAEAISSTATPSSSPSPSIPLTSSTNTSISQPQPSSPSVSLTTDKTKDKSSTPPPQRNDPKASAAKPPVTSTSTSPFLSSHEPTTELKEGVEWVSFVYSHHRTLRRYCIRTDLDKVDTSILDEKFKKENCVYPRANLPRETYRGNRWSYETECNVLGWKLAYLNLEEIAGKRGLIQRAVDSYRNRYPSMRSRRVARQEKLLKGTLRKRKHRETAAVDDDDHTNKSAKNHSESSDKAPKTILIEDSGSTTKCRIRINIDSVVLDAVDLAFRKNNCVFPRAMNITSTTPSVSQRKLDEAKCNEIGWKLAWLNPRQLANKKNLLQRALDTYRNQFAPDLKPRKYASRVAPAPYLPPAAPPPLSQTPAATEAANVAEVPNEEESNNAKEKMIDAETQVNNNKQSIPLTVQALADQQKELLGSGLADVQTRRRDSTTGQSCYSGTTVTLDFHDYCFSPPPEEDVDLTVSCEEDTIMQDVSTAANSPLFTAHTNMFEDFIMASLPIPDTSKDMLMSDQLLGNNNNNSCTSSDESNGSSYQNTPSPQALITLSEIYQQAFLMSSTADDGSVPGNIFSNSNHNKEDTLFLMSDNASDDVNSNVIDLIAKYGGVNAGVDDFTSTSSSITDPSLLNQLF